MFSRYTSILCGILLIPATWVNGLNLALSVVQATGRAYSSQTTRLKSRRIVHWVSRAVLTTIVATRQSETIDVLPVFEILDPGNPGSWLFERPDDSESR